MSRPLPPLRLAGLLASVLASLLALPAFAQTVSVSATVETDPALTGGDAVDDPAIWVHPDDTGKSLLIATDKQSGLFVYGLDGKTLQRLDDGDMGNVDLRYNFPLGGKKVSQVVANNRTTNGLSVYVVDPSSRRLTSVGAGTLPTGLVPYGACMYRSAATGRFYAFVNDKNGVVQQWELSDDGAGKVAAKKVREFDAGSQVEGCVADDELGHFYLGEEAVGVWKYAAEPGGGATRTQLDKTGAGGRLTADVEGLAIYHSAQGQGYVIVSSQGNNTFVLYRRDGTNAYVGTFRIADGALDGVTDCDGIEVTNRALGSAFPQGLFVAQDFDNPGANQNFKLVPWQTIAQAFTPPLTVDLTGFDPRLGGADAPGGSGPDGGTPPGGGADAGTGGGGAGVADAGTGPGVGAPGDDGPGADEDGDEQTPGARDPDAEGPESGPRVDAPAGCSAAPALSLPLLLVLLGAGLGARRSRVAQRRGAGRSRRLGPGHAEARKRRRPRGAHPTRPSFLPGG